MIFALLAYIIVFLRALNRYFANNKFGYILAGEVIESYLYNIYPTNLILDSTRLDLIRPLENLIVNQFENIKKIRL